MKLFRKNPSAVFAALLAAFAAQTAAHASTIAIVDSGSDLTHPDLVKKAWVNPQDDADLGYAGDIHGWNFVDNNNTLVDMSQLNQFSPDVYQFFDVQTRQLEGQETDADKQWIASHKNDQKFLAQLEAFGDFAHGTNVAGIASKDAAQAKLMALKMIGSPAPSTNGKSLLSELQNFFAPDFVLGFQDHIIRDLIDALVSGSDDSNGVDAKIGAYLQLKSPRVANCSFGNDLATVKSLVRHVILLAGGVLYSESDLEKYYDYMMQKMLATENQQLIQPAEKTLFVIAAGNDSSDNDKYFSAPANIKADNTIAVAATLGRQSLAPFSNFGATTVEVAAPGVGIYSDSPGGKYVRMSGTSQASPYVTNAAGQVIDANKSLSPLEVKQILIGTVDVKDFLKGKVSSSGIVNPARAIRAAELSKSESLSAAIADANKDVADLADNTPTPSAAPQASVPVDPLKGEYNGH